LSALGENVLAPVPAHRDEKVCCYFIQPIQDGSLEVFNVAGERVALSDKEGSAGLCWDPSNTSPGVYYVRVKAVFADGTRADFWRKALVVP
jgi:hypothetical protein